MRLRQLERHSSTSGDFGNGVEQEKLPELRNTGGPGILITIGLKLIGSLKGSGIFS